MATKAVNQRAIARELKISPATVSKCFNNRSDINSGTRARVLEVASRLGYRFDTSADEYRAATGPRKMRFIGVLFHTAATTVTGDGDPAGFGFLTGLSEAAGAQNVSLIVHRFGGDSADILEERYQPAALREGLLEGLVLIHRFEHRAVHELAAQVPCVTLSHFVPSAPVNHVDSDHVRAIGRLMDHLHGLGHRRIGYLGRKVSFAYSQARFASYVQSLARLGMELELGRIVNTLSDLQDPDAQAEVVAKQVREGVTGWVCANDGVAYELLKRLKARGLEAPRDLSITGYDLAPPVAGLPKLTSVRVPFEEMGAAALTRLIGAIDRPHRPVRQTMLDCDVVVGETTGVVPQAK